MILTTKNLKTWHKKTFGGDGYVYYHDYGDGIKSICIRLSSSMYTLNKYFCVFLVYELYFNKAVKNKQKRPWSFLLDTRHYWLPI